MEIKLFMAQTVNAKIARVDGSEDFLSPRNWKEFKKIAKRMGVFAVGRTTYEEVREWEEKGFADVNALCLVVSRKDSLSMEEGFKQVSSPEKAIETAEEHGFSNLLVTGGSSLNTSFIDKGLVDKVVVNIEPYILGRGLGLFSEGDFEMDMKLIEARELEEDIVKLTYSV